MNDCDLAAYQAIEQRRFTDVRATDDGDVRRSALAVHRTEKPRSVPFGVSVAFGLQLAHTIHHVNDAGNECENPGDDDNEEQGKKMQLQHHPRDRAHLANGRNFAGPIRLDLHFAIEQMQDNRADEDDGVAGDDENGKPRRKSSVIRVKFAPVRDTQRDDAAEE